MDIVAIVSGGMDSITMAYYINDRYPHKDLHLLSFDYGQRHKKELEFAQQCAFDIGADWDVVDLSGISSLLAQSKSVLVDPSMEVPEGHYAADNMKSTVVPNRNAIMLSIATGVAVASGAAEVWTGVHAGDHFIYPDCRPEFIYQMSHTMILANEGFAQHGFHIEAPFLNQSKTDIAKLGKALQVDYAQTWSCYNGRERHCGKCGTCVERHEALEGAFGFDVTAYE